MANFWQTIIDKITGQQDDDKTGESKPAPTNIYNPAKDNTSSAYQGPVASPKPAVAPLNISHVAAAAAASADPKVEAAKQAAAKAEAEKILAAARDDDSRKAAEATVSAVRAMDEKANAAAKEIADAAEQFEIIKEHKLTYDDTLSALALHFYGHATPEYWGLIILANKNTIGGTVKDYTPGKVIKIPKLPDSMKNK
ncbi:MAG: hypothetical protein LWX83_15330 [Anaerolineae bacterium]|nr:hypothetical protein [Anaerolineae bacterium]